MTPARPDGALVRLALAFAILFVGMVGGATTLWSAEADDRVGAVEIEFEPESEQDPEPEDERDDDDDDAVHRGDADGLASLAASMLPATNEFAHPSRALDRLFRPPIA